MTTRKRFALNVASTYLLKAVNIICSFILPRLFLSYYGSEVNGLVSSVTQFLSVIAFADMGVGTVVLSALYKPISDHDDQGISRIISSASRFYRHLGLIYAAYVAVLCVTFPSITDTSYDTGYVAALVLIMSVNNAAQYFFGIVSKQFLTAAQKRFIVSLSDSGVMMANTICCILLIRAGYGIHAVKLSTVLWYSFSPLLYHLYIRKHYDIDWHARYEEEPIRQKWNGLAQHISYFVNINTDVVVLTLLRSVREVSVYSVYALVLKGISAVLTAVDSAIQPVLGKNFADNDSASFRQHYLYYQAFMMSAGTVLYGCACTLILSFVRIYTRGITDADYLVPPFAILIVTAGLIDFWCSLLRMLVNVTGSFRETQKYYILTAVINIVLSVMLAVPLGMTGAAIGTLAASLYQLFSLGVYVYREIIHESISTLLALTGFNSSIYLLGAVSYRLLPESILTYTQWILYAIPVLVIWCIGMMAAALITGRKSTIRYLTGLVRLLGIKGMAHEKTVHDEQHEEDKIIY